MRVPIIAAVLLIHAAVFAQMNTGGITGSIKDQTGAVLPGARVVAERSGTGQKFTADSNDTGEYLLGNLSVGTYSIHVSALNFKPSVSTADVHAGDSLRFDFTLQVGDGSDVVVVAADAGVLQSDSAEIKDVIQNRQVVALPLKGRQFLDLAMLSEGVVRPPGGTRGDAMQQAGNLVNVLGQRSGHNLYLMDGVTVTDEHFNNLVIAPSIDSIEEFNIQKTSYAPEFGGKSGAVINVITKSGSNRLSGTLLEFVRNDVFDAKNFFDAAGARIPPFHQNQFGGSLGGPVKRNRTFFFVNYEAQRVRKSLTQTFSVPKAAERGGDFAGFAPVYDPSSTPSSGMRLPFPNNRIPRVDPIAAALLLRIPLPNLPGIGQNLLATDTQKIDTNAYTARLDHQFNDKNAAYLRASLFDARESDPFGSSVLQETLLPGFGRTLSTHSINGVAGWTHTFSANVLNEARFGFLTVVGGQKSPNAGTDFAAQAGLLGVTSNPLDTGYPQVSFGGQFTAMGDPALFTYRNNRDFEFSDNLTIHRGRHTVKLGGYWMQYNLQPVNPNGARGVFSYTPRWTSSAPGLADGNAFADFLLGDPTTAQVGLGRGTMNGTALWAHAYAQDSWQATSQLKIDVGIRYEYNRNMTDSGNHLAAVDPFTPGGRFVIASDAAGNLSPEAAALLPFIPIPYVTSAAAGWNNSLLTTKPFRLAPRAGFAWNLPALKMVLRGGIGIYPNQAAYSIVTNLAQNLPFFVTKTINSSAAAPFPTFSTANALTANTIGTAGANNLNHSYAIEYNEVWNLNLDRELPGGTVLTAAYLGSRTVHADSATVLNVPTPGPGPIAARRPIPQLSQMSTIRWDGWATYHALALGVKRRLARGLMFDANWTWSHSIDDASDPGATLNEANVPQDVHNMTAEKASSSFDHRQRVVVSFVYQLPSPRAAASRLNNPWPRAAASRLNQWTIAVLGNWQAGGYFTAQSGAPFTVNTSTDPANIGSGPAQRPNVSGDPNTGPHTPNQWFNTSLFSLPPLYTFGDFPRNGLIGPTLEEFDFSLQKEIALTRESTRLQFRAEAYNLFNHPNFNIPNRTAFTANFAQISSAQDSRQLQFALKLLF